MKNKLLTLMLFVEILLFPKLIFCQQKEVQLNFKPENTETKEALPQTENSASSASAVSTAATEDKKNKSLLEFGNEKNSVKIGGYGSIRFEYGSGKDLKDTFTFRRFVLSTEAKIESKFKIGTEIEFERFRKIELERTASRDSHGLTVSQGFEGTNESEISIEQAFFELDYKNWLRFKGGGVLVPLGRFNINHDDNRWNLPRRTLVDRGAPVLPVTAAWNELGVGVNGDIEIGEKSNLSYQFYVLNGAVIAPELETSVSGRAGDTSSVEHEAEFNVSTGTFGRDVKNAKSFAGRINYSPSLGHEFAVSAYFGRYTPSYLIGKNLSAFAFDTYHQFGNFEIEGEYVYSHLGSLRDVMGSFAQAVFNGSAQAEDATTPPGVETEVAFKPSRLAETKHGYWVEMRYRLKPDWLTRSWFGKHFSDPVFIPVLRWEQVFINGRLAEGTTIESGAVTSYVKEDRRIDRITAGLAFRLNPLSVFHLAYEYTQTNKGGSLASVTNFLETTSSKNHAIMVGAAFGF